MVICFIHVQASNAYLQRLLGQTNKILFEFVKEMPQPGRKLRLDLSSLLGPLFFTWVILQLFPVSSIFVIFYPFLFLPKKSLYSFQFCALSSHSI